MYNRLPGTAQTCPFLMRTFVKVNGFHPLAVFESNKLPIDDEYQIYTWWVQSAFVLYL